jgi:hypothetical protein
MISFALSPTTTHWKTLHSHAVVTQEMRNEATSSCSSSTKPKNHSLFRSQHHRMSFHSPPPLGSTHDLWANEILRFLLPTNPHMHWIKFYCGVVVMMMMMMIVLTLAILSLMLWDGTMVKTNGWFPNGLFLPPIIHFLFLLSILIILCGWWIHWYHTTTLCHLTYNIINNNNNTIINAKPWMDPNVVSMGEQPMHVPLRLFDSTLLARQAACRPDLACFVTSNINNKTNQQGIPSPCTATIASGLTSNVWLLDPLPCWKFQLHPTVEAALQNVIHTTSSSYSSSSSSSSSASTWQSVTIPSNWMLQDNVNDIPIYTNQKYPFPCQPPIVPIQNPTGIYQLDFMKATSNDQDAPPIMTTTAAIWPHQWQLQDDNHPNNNNNNNNDNEASSFPPYQYSLLLHGIESACFVYWNGTLIGYCQDSRLPHEFVLPHDIMWKETTKTQTAIAAPAAAVLHLIVIRWSDGSYLEDQDHWWMAGVHRSVEVIRRPFQADIMDYHVLADFNDDDHHHHHHDRPTHGHLHVSVSLRESSRIPKATTMMLPKERTIRVRLFDDVSMTADGTKCILADSELWSATETIRGEDSSVIVVLEGDITNIKPWTAETPYLYTLVIEQLLLGDDDNDGDKVVAQCESCRVGFRTVTIDHHHNLPHNGDGSGGGGGVLKINDRAITVCGINRHEHDPDHGKVVSLERMMQEITILKCVSENDLA